MCTSHSYRWTIFTYNLNIKNFTFLKIQEFHLKMSRINTNSKSAYFEQENMCYCCWSIGLTFWKPQVFHLRFAFNSEWYAPEQCNLCNYQMQEYVYCLKRYLQEMWNILNGISSSNQTSSITYFQKSWTICIDESVTFATIKQ